MLWVHCAPARAFYGLHVELVSDSDAQDNGSAQALDCSHCASGQIEDAPGLRASSGTGVLGSLNATSLVSSCDGDQVQCSENRSCVRRPGGLRWTCHVILRLSATAPGAPALACRSYTVSVFNPQVATLCETHNWVPSPRALKGSLAVWHHTNANKFEPATVANCSERTNKSFKLKSITRWRASSCRAVSFSSHDLAITGFLQIIDCAAACAGLPEAVAASMPTLTWNNLTLRRTAPTS